MGSDDDDDDDDAKDAAGALNNIVQPLRKQLKKQGTKIEKMNAAMTKLGEDSEKTSAQFSDLEQQISGFKIASTQLKSMIDACPWRHDGERIEATIKAMERRLADELGEQRVHLAAHSQTFQTTQSAVADSSKKLAILQAELGDGGRRSAEELRVLTARFDHMRGELFERMAHTLDESKSHSDRLNQRAQDELTRLDQEVSLRANSKSVAETTAGINSELHEVRAANDDLRRELRSNAAQLQELKEITTNQVSALKIELLGITNAVEQRLHSLEDVVHRMEAAQRESDAALHDGNFSQRQQLMEGRQVAMERSIKQLEAKLISLGEELANRPVKTDILEAFAKQEMAAEASASQEQVAHLQEAVDGCAPAATVAALQEAMRSAQAQLAKTAAGLSELREDAASKAALAQRGKEIEGLKQRVEEKLGRDEGSALLDGKLDKLEAQSILKQHETLQGSMVSAQANAKLLQDALSNMSHDSLDAQGSVKQVNARMDRLSAMAHELDGRLNQRKTEVLSLTRVVRLMLEDAEMRCAIDEAEGATAAEATDVLTRLRGSPRGNGAPMAVSGVTLHRQPGGPLQPMPPGSAGADKILYKTHLQPRGEMLGARRRILVNARHSWVGDACLARDDHRSEDPDPGGGSTAAGEVRTPRPPSTTTFQTPSA